MIRIYPNETFKDATDRIQAERPDLTRSAIKRLLEKTSHRIAVREQDVKGDARYAPLSPAEPQR